MNVQKVCVYCASSRQCDPAYHDAASALGKELAANDITIVYGGGLVGSMGAMANAALAHGGRVIGILPQFMHELEWGHNNLTELVIVNDIHERKRMMISDVDAVIALPGGCGTLEELFEAITWKRLGLYSGPIVLVNTLDFFAPCLELLNRCIEQRLWIRGTRRCGPWQTIRATSSTRFIARRDGIRQTARSRRSDNGEAEGVILQLPRTDGNAEDWSF